MVDKNLQGNERNPWEAECPSSVALFLLRAVADGMITQEEMEDNRKQVEKKSAVVHQIKLQNEIAALQTEVNKTKLERQKLELVLDTADVSHQSLLLQKTKKLQRINGELEGVLKERRALTQRLLEPTTTASVALDANYHRQAVELLSLVSRLLADLEGNVSLLHEVNAFHIQHKKLNEEWMQLSSSAQLREEAARALLRLQDGTQLLHSATRPH